MLTEGYILVSRKLVEKKVFRDKEQLGILFQMLLMARFKSCMVEGTEVKVNQFYGTKKKLAEEFGVSEGKLRGILASFEKQGILTTKNIKNKYTLICLSDELVKWAPPVKKKKNGYYEDNRQAEEASVKSATAKENGENNDEALKAYGEFKNVYLTDMEYEKLSRSTLSQRDAYINKLSAYLKINPEKRYTSHYALLVRELSEKKLRGREALDTVSEDDSYQNGTASYDIRRAEERARTQVPKLKKRERR